jgi:glyceraldehyde 3-phosphate dehydrogenase
VAINDLMALDNLVYLLKYDTVYGRYARKVEMASSDLLVAGKRYPCLSEKEPARLPWRTLFF